MRNSILILAAATCLAGASTAHAQDSGQAPAKAFAGPRAEVTIGVDRSGDDDIYGSELTGMRAGGAIGYDVAIGKRVTLGIEAGIGWMVAGHTTVGPANGIVPQIRVSEAHDADISARLGFAASSKTLIYGKAGWADRAQRATDGSRTYYNNDGDGLRLGAGIEQKLTRNVYAKAEYRYTMYSVPGDNDPKRHQLVTGIGVRF